MRTAGLTMNDVWAHRVPREPGVQTSRLEEMDAEIGVLVESLDLKHRGKEENYRPYLHATGELRSVTPAEALPYGISQVTYSPGRGEKVDAFYEFDDEQLVMLASKGYFTNTFVVPEQVTGIEWELPATVDMLVLAPADTPIEDDAPVVFTQVHGIGGLEIDLESSGYDLAEYFADHTKDGIRQAEAIVDERGLRARSDAINSLFTEHELDLEETAEYDSDQPAAQDEPVGAGVSAGLQQVEAEIAAETEQFRAEREHTEGTPEHLYHQRVAQALRTDENEAKHAESPAPRRSARSPQSDLSFDPDLEIKDQEPRQQEDEPASDLDARKHEVSRRAADLDFGNEDEQSLGS